MSTAPQVRPRRKVWRRVLVVAAIVGILGYFGSYANMASVQVGDRAPMFEAVTHTGRPLKLADYLGQQTVVLYFYPRDNTPGCTAQACSFRDDYEAFTAAGAVVIGISSDSSASHEQFAAQKRLPFELVSDPDNRLRKLYGVPNNLFVLPGRVTYVIDREGIVRLVFNSQLNATGHVAEALKIVEQLAKPKGAGK